MLVWENLDQVLLGRNKTKRYTTQYDNTHLQSAGVLLIGVTLGFKGELLMKQALRSAGINNRESLCMLWSSFTSVF